MKNPLLSNDILFQPCPKPLPFSLMHTADDGKAEFSAMRCGKTQCPACGLRNERNRIQRFGQRVAADTEGGVPVRRFFITIGFAPHPNPLKSSTALELLDHVGQVVKQTRQPQIKKQWPGANLAFIKVIHLSGPAPHMHLLLSQYANPMGGFASKEDLRTRLAHFWNLHLARMIRDQEIPRHPTPHTGQVYCMQSRNLMGSLAYQLWEKGQPWKGEWRFPKGKPRVRASKGFLPKLEQEWARPAGTLVVVQGNVDAIEAAFAPTDTPAFRITSTRIGVTATKERRERVITFLSRR
jgi:hypothetical protein